MTDFDLETRSLKELKQLQKDVAKAISSFENRKKAEARVALEETAREMGFSLDQLVGSEGRTKRAPAAPKYKHPENNALGSGLIANR